MSISALFQLLLPFLQQLLTRLQSSKHPAAAEVASAVEHMEAATKVHSALV